jgi:hypothetical protein
MPKYLTKYQGLLLTYWNENRNNSKMSYHTALPTATCVADSEGQLAGNCQMLTLDSDLTPCTLELIQSVR